MCEWEDFDTVRKRIAKEWPSLPRTYDNISPELKVKIGKVVQEIKERQKNS